MTLSIANLPEDQRATTVEFATYQMDDDAFYDRSGVPVLSSK
ncbi:hypothetical protein [Spirosoma validum]|nr:hypothetical protein [Spirosoma validum]